MDDRIAIRTMTRVDLDRAIDWAAAEGWNPGLDDAAPFRAADPDGFLMAFRDGAPVACISAVAYGARFGFLGFYVCAAEQRGRGFGMAVWRVALDRLGDRVIGLDGVVAQQDNYRKSGFVLAHRNVRYGGTVAIDERADPRIVPIDGTLRDAIVAYDQPFFPGPRRAFLEAWLTPARRRGLAYVEDGAVRGYGVVRACRNGHKIGPLFADDAAIADALFRALAAEAGGGPVFLDPPESNRALPERYGLEPVFETARMYRGPAPALPLARLYGITTFELG